MITCPWCEAEVVLLDHICPQCKHEVLPEHLEGSLPERRNGNVEGGPEEMYHYGSIEPLLRSKFRCSKCGHDDCYVKEVAMSGTGLSKLFDIEYNHYLFVSCSRCGYVEVYNPDVLRGRTSGEISTILDILFG